MASKHLLALRRAARDLADEQSAYIKEAARLKRNYGSGDIARVKLQEQARAAASELGKTRADLATRAEAIRKAAQTSPIAIDDLSRQRVLAALAAGSSYHEIAQTLVDLKDRAGLAALKEQLPYEALAKRMDSRQVKDALTVVGQMETPLLSEQEAAARAELREVDACWHAQESNFKALGRYYENEQNPVLTGHAPAVDTLYGWWGTPDCLGDPVQLTITETPAVGQQV